jgi:hypothetical protein
MTHRKKRKGKISITKSDPPVASLARRETYKNEN